MTLLAAAVIVHDLRRGRIVVLRRGQGAKYGEGMWDLPVGKVEGGESVIAGAVRELWEETGVVVKAEDLRLAHVVHGAWGVESPNGFVTVVFVAHAWVGEPVNREPGKHEQVCWAEADDLPDGFVPSIGVALRAYLDGGPPAVTLRGWS
ncbi:NUDIX domain-containing protein [Actinacidiphila bryophytorum]|uniref:NUDIX domain-containing protein n=1 Tax=Actinacidiphila bryophytorum TaxID=1436133 RepID=UPI0021769CDF|nr:NUDIX domain-containing protein [Actinacidiphila bryophytorum]UWE12963.1 NUDIX domain-containing protein [Actinacidiphila bryophytorum]